MIRFTEQEIDGYISEKKVLPANYRSRLQPRVKRAHRERDFEIQGDRGSVFRVTVRENVDDPMDFSVILMVRIPGSNKWFKLRRYNGKAHEHTNKIEKEKFWAYHIHQATERYQELDQKEELFATPTERYTTCRGAVELMIDECGFIRPESESTPLLEDLQ